MDQINGWYNELAKPGWTPSPQVIGLIWALLYPIILVSFGFVFTRIWQRRLSPWAGLPFIINLIANLAFTPLQFGLHSLVLATLDIIIVFATIIWAMATIWTKHRWVAVAMVPYLLWVATASLLQIQIALAN